MEPFTVLEKTKLSLSLTVYGYRRLEAAANKPALAQFIVERFNERYFQPINDSPSKHGFAIMAVACLVIETLESFYQGRADTRNVSAQMFQDFFGRDADLKVFAGGNDWFYKDIRCGILHQSETRVCWRILRKGSLLDVSGKTINAAALLDVLQRAVELYALQLQTNEVLWKNFLKKMDAVCANCQ